VAVGLYTKYEEGNNSDSFPQRRPSVSRGPAVPACAVYYTVGQKTSIRRRSTLISRHSHLLNAPAARPLEHPDRPTYGRDGATTPDASERTDRTDTHSLAPFSISSLDLSVCLSVSLWWMPLQSTEHRRRTLHTPRKNMFERGGTPWRASGSRGLGVDPLEEKWPRTKIIHTKPNPKAT